MAYLYLHFTLIPQFVILCLSNESLMSNVLFDFFSNACLFKCTYVPDVTNCETMTDRYVRARRQEACHNDVYWMDVAEVTLE